MKKILFIMMSLFILLSMTSKVNAQITVSARNAMLLDGNTGRILYEKDAYAQHPIASLTKIMTAIVALEAVPLDSKVTISQAAANQEGSACPLTAGDTLTMEDLLYCLMLRSGNDAAYAIAEYVGGNIPNFVRLMNQKAKTLGLNQTVFTNPSGLDVPSSNLSSAYDLAKLTQYGMTNENFREISGAKQYQTTSTLGIPYSWVHKHRLVNNVDYVIAGKTGFTRKAGRTLVSVAKKGNQELIAVTLTAPNDWEDHIKMFEYGFNLFGIRIETDRGFLKEKTEEDN